MQTNVVDHRNKPLPQLHEQLAYHATPCLQFARPVTYRWGNETDTIPLLKLEVVLTVTNTFSIRLASQHMNTKLRWNDWAGLSARFASAPWELRAFAVFSLIITLVGYTLPVLGPKKLWEAIIPFTGWSPGANYGFFLFPTAAVIFGRPALRGRNPRNVLRWLSVLMLAIQIYFGEFQQRLGGLNDFGNPYLIVSPWRFVWTELVPAFWILVLVLPRMNKFVEESEPTDMTLPASNS